jgi:hypothetical protein
MFSLLCAQTQSIHFYRKIRSTPVTQRRTLFSRLRSLSVGSIVALVLGGLLATGMPVMASAATVNPVITFTASGVPIAGLHFRIYENNAAEYFPGVEQDDPATDDIYEQWTTDDNGVVEFPGLSSTKSYYIEVINRSYTDVNGVSSKDLHAGGWMSGTASHLTAEWGDATPVSFATSQSRTIALGMGVTITGDVLAPNGDAVPEDMYVTVRAYRQTTDIGSNEITWEEEKGTPTGDAHYTFSGLRPGKYVIQAEQTEHELWAPESYNDGALSKATATPLTILSGSADQNTRFVTASGIDGSLLPAQSQYGDYRVVAYAVASNGSIEPNKRIYATFPDYTAPEFVFRGLQPGDYKVYFESIREGYSSQWYSNGYSEETATTITVTGDAYSHLDAVTLGNGFTLEGTVSVDGGEPVAGIVVSASDLEDTTDENGHFSFENLPAGEYDVRYDDPSEKYVRYYATPTGPTTSFDLAAPIGGVSGVVTADLVYPKTGSLTVTVLDNKGKKILSNGFGVVNAIPIDNGIRNDDKQNFEGTRTSQAGIYTFSNLIVGQDYAIEFNPNTFVNRTIYPQFLGGDVLENATPFTVHEGANTLDFKLNQGAGLWGRVTTTAGKSLNGVTVELIEYVGGQWDLDNARPYKSIDYGWFWHLAVKPGLYTLRYTTEGTSQSSYVSTYAGGASTPETAKHFYLAPGKDLEYNLSLAAGATITGTTTKVGAGQPVSSGVKAGGVKVTPISIVTGSNGSIVSESPNYRRSVTTAANGTFTIKGLAAGTYKLRYEDTAGLYGELASSTPTRFSVAGGKTTASGTHPLFSLSEPSIARTSLSFSLAEPVALYHDSGWFKSVVRLTDATGTTFTLEPDENGEISTFIANGKYTWVADYTSANLMEFETKGGAFNATGTPLAYVVQLDEKTPLRFLTGPTIAATSVVGEPTTIQATWNEAATTTAEYRWFRNGVLIFGARGASYIPRGSDIGAVITARVSINTNSVPFEQIVTEFTEPTEVIAATTLNSQSPPSISTTTLKPGTLVRADPGHWSVQGARFSYEWILDGEIVGTAATYMVKPADFDGDVPAELAVRVTASKSGYVTPDAVTSSTKPIVSAGTLVPVKQPTISAAVKNGTRTLTIKDGTWNVAGVASSYVWRIGTGVVGEGKTFSLPADVGLEHPLTAIATGSKPGYSPGDSARIVGLKSYLPLGYLEPVYVTTPNWGVIFEPVALSTGDVLTAHPGIWLDEEGTTATSVTFAWLRNGTPIKGATKSSYVMTTADVGKEIAARATWASSLYAPGVGQSVAGTGVVGTFEGDYLDGIITVPTTLAGVGAPLVASVRDFTSVTGEKVTLQWYLCDPAASDCDDRSDFVTKVAKATKATITPTAALLGKKLQLRAVATKTGFTSATVVSPIVTVGVPPITVVNGPYVEGGVQAIVGKKYVVTPGQYSPASVTKTYVWEACTPTDDGCDELTVVGTGLSFTPTAAHVGKFVTVTETAARAGFSSTEETTYLYAPVSAGTPVAVKAAKITTTPSSYIASGATFAPAGGTVTYEWLRNGVSVSTGATYTRQPNDAALIQVITKYSELPGYISVQAPTTAQRGGAPTTQTVYPDGSAAVGQSVQVQGSPFFFPGALSKPAVLTYQWLVSGKPIAKATNSTFPVVAAYLGKQITVTITGTTAEYAPGVYTTPYVIAQPGAAASPNPSVSPSSNVKPGTTLTTTVAANSGYTTTFVWQEFVNDEWRAIAGATKATYKLTIANAGHSVRVVVSTARVGYASRSQSSDEIPVEYTDDVYAITAPTLSTNGKSGATLTLAPGTWNVPVKLAYTWMRGNSIMRGVTGTTYQLTGHEIGDEISVVVTATAGGYNTAVVPTNDVTVVLGDAPTSGGLTITGAAKSCSTVSVAIPSWSRDGVQISYQWYIVDGSTVTPIENATNRSLLIPSDAAGKKVQVIATATRTGFANGVTSVTSGTVGSNCG